ncbi:hypothetical protein BAY61_09235 [Prauserella marina]|uniref:Uncharacterized protein n=1 Tax=Prauserella marina TaxID=530584 RepID=A0A222VML4_9PSEU|nr:hypothetical protein [Prauserella marina]ASR35137.1 hypothetical protein BAY61_09235 [Prauserella marina]PWV85107.1 hypothetical protein DES30_1011130 [Prauserella marina]SDC04615.1 hypothetical protein SAMN05421630_101208 [Prauserella marina]
MRRIDNLHVRVLAAPRQQVGELIDSLSGSQDMLWPSHAWPKMRLSGPLGAGAEGGHGPIRYRVESCTPGAQVRFRFSAPRGFDGFHEFAVHSLSADVTRLTHLLVLRPRFPASITAPLVWLPLHDALIEDCLDLAELAVTGTIAEPARWSPYVRALRAVAGLPAATRWFRNPLA